MSLVRMLLTSVTGVQGQTSWSQFGEAMGRRKLHLEVMVLFGTAVQYTKSPQGGSLVAKYYSML